MHEFDHGNLRKILDRQRGFRHLGFAAALNGDSVGGGKVGLDATMPAAIPVTASEAFAVSATATCASFAAARSSFTASAAAICRTGCG